MLHLIEKVLSVAPHVLIVIENPQSKAFPRLPRVQRVLAKPGWQLRVGSHCSNTDKIDGGPWLQKDTLYLTYITECWALGDSKDFELGQCRFDCQWLIPGT